MAKTYPDQLGLTSTQRLVDHLAGKPVYLGAEVQVYPVTQGGPSLSYRPFDEGLMRHDIHVLLWLREEFAQNLNAASQGEAERHPAVAWLVRRPDRVGFLFGTEKAARDFAEEGDGIIDGDTIIPLYARSAGEGTPLPDAGRWVTVKFVEGDADFFCCGVKHHLYFNGGELDQTTCKTCGTKWRTGATGYVLQRHALLNPKPEAE